MAKPIRRIETNQNPDLKVETSAIIAEKLQAKFQWTDEEDKASEVNMECSDAEIEECIDKIKNYILQDLSQVHFSATEECVQFKMPVPPILHRLLIDRFDQNLSLDSRIQIFDSVRDGLSAVFQENTEQLNAKITECMPSDNLRKKFIVDEVMLFDDALALDTEFSPTSLDCISVEINLQLVAN